MTIQQPLTDLDAWWQCYGVAYEDRTWRDYRHIVAEAIRQGAEPPILDVGCGYGFLVECARRFNIPSTGLEASERAIAECRVRHPLADVRSWRGGTPLPFDSATIGIAVVSQFVDHI